MGLSAGKASAVIGVAAATLKRWESGCGTPRESTVDRILDAWGVPEVSQLREGFRLETLGRKVSWSVEQNEVRPVLRMLRHKRRRNGLRLEDVAQATGIGLPSLQRYETGLRVPAEPSLQLISQAVGCSAEEFELLRNFLTNPDPISSPISATVLFTKPMGTPGFLIFRELDYLLRFRREQTANEIHTRLQAIILGLAFTGDYSALVETWQGTAHFLGRPKSLSITESVAGMAKMHLARRPREALDEFLKLRRMLPATPKTDDEINGTFCAIRMGQLLKEHEDADDLLRRIEHSSGLEESAKVACAVYRCLVDFSVGEASDSVTGLQEIGRNADPVLAYTTRVGAASILVQMGKYDDGLDVLEGCRSLETSYGLGSPLARKLDAKIAVA